MEMEMGGEAAAECVGGGGGGLWTDERHVSFLNWMEASFVRRLLETDRPRRLVRRPRLDRFVPDSAESTRDGQTREATEAKAEIKFRRTAKAERLPPPPQGQSQDQVVPELGSREQEKNDRGDGHGGGLVIRA